MITKLFLTSVVSTIIKQARRKLILYQAYGNGRGSGKWATRRGKEAHKIIEWMKTF